MIPRLVSRFVPRLVIGPALFLGVGLALAVLLFWALQRRLGEPWMAVSTHPEVLETLDESLDDQRRLAELDPEKEDVYRRRFEERATLLQRLRVLRHARADLVRRYEQILLGIFGFTLVLVTAGWLWRQRRQEKRLDALRDALEDLARGEPGVRVQTPKRRDLIGRIAAMVEETAGVMARDRRRLKALENLSAWQEAARRHAHEMRTPLTAARLELRRLDDLVSSPDAHQATRGVEQELERLGVFARRFTSFARLPSPRRERRELGPLLEEIFHTFGDAWPGLELRLERDEAPDEGVEAAVDGEMLRQVLVNLLDNASQAGSETATLRLGADRAVARIDVADDGPGIDRRIRRRLFEPYTTTRGVGEGMGLGLAICRKIVLDHGGELELVETSAAGTVFRITLPRHGAGDGGDHGAGAEDERLRP